MPTGVETIQVVRRPKKDKLSTATPAAEDTFDVKNCQVIPRQSFEEGRGWVTLDGWDIYVLKEPEREILYTDLVNVRGIEYQIQGKPARFDKRGVFKAIKIVAVEVGAPQ